MPSGRWNTCRRSSSTISRAAIQTNALSSELSYRFGDAPYFHDRAAFPKGTPRDGKINVIASRGLSGSVIARVDTVEEAIEAIERHSGRTASLAKPRGAGREQRAEGRAS